MADAALENAMARRDAIAKDIDRVAREINELLERHKGLVAQVYEVENFIRMWHEMAGTQPPAELEQSKKTAPAEGGRRVRPRNPDKRAVAEQCVNYIREAGKPLMRKHLMRLLANDGVEIRGTDPLMVLSTMLWRSKDIIRRLPEGGYWPAGEPSPMEKDLNDLLSHVEIDL